MSRSKPMVIVEIQKGMLSAVHTTTENTEIAVFDWDVICSPTSDEKPAAAMKRLAGLREVCKHRAW